MLQAFFENTAEGNAHLFKGTRVWADPAHRAEQGKYPVISITFKDAKGADWAATRTFLEYAVAEEFRRHAVVFSSSGCNAEWKAASEAIRMGNSNDGQLSASLGILAAALHAHYGERPVILVDEYDSPINWAATRGFGEEALQFFRNFLSGAMKDGKHCRLGVITGILRVAKEGVLSGLNNIEVWSVFDKDYSDCFGFTEEEVRGLLATYGHPEKIDEAKAWYDGYRFGDTEIYNPWSLLNYVRQDFAPRPFWANTSSNDLVTAVLSRMTPRRRDELADIFEKGEREVPCATELGPYGLLQANPQIIWSLLVHTGYLKAKGAPNANGQAVLSFPNRELRQVFKQEILTPVNCAPTAGDDLQDILSSLTHGDAEKFRKSLEAFLVSSASYFDMAHEDFFHGLVLGLLAALGEDYEVKSNREAGDGRPDVAMKPRQGVPLPGVILEFKTPKVPPRASQKRVETLLAAAAREARDQIDKNRYAVEMERELAERDQPLVTRHSSLVTAQDAPPRVLRYGVGFLGKRVALAK